MVVCQAALTAARRMRCVASCQTYLEWLVGNPFSIGRQQPSVVEGEHAPSTDAQPRTPAPSPARPARAADGLIVPAGLAESVEAQAGARLAAGAVDGNRPPVQAPGRAAAAGRQQATESRGRGRYAAAGHQGSGRPRGRQACRQLSGPGEAGAHRPFHGQRPGGAARIPEGTGSEPVPGPHHGSRNRALEPSAARPAECPRQADRRRGRAAAGEPPDTDLARRQ